MAFLTSYRYRGIELNDGINFLVPLADTSFDDRNAAEASWAYRKGDVPVQTGIVVKEGRFVLPINVKATSRADFFAKVQQLKALFNPADAAVYKFERKLQHETVWSWIMAAPREFSVDAVNWRIVVTMEAADRAWNVPTWNEQTAVLFTGAPRTEYMTINYGGATPVEPIIEITALTEGIDGPRPLYYRLATVWTQAAQHIVHEPLLIAQSWNTNTEVAEGQMHADGSDISVELLDGTVIDRRIAGTQAARRVWILPHTWPQRFDVVLAANPNTNELLDDPFLRTAEMSMRVTMTPAGVDGNTQTVDFPTSGTICVGDELIVYNAVRWLNDEKTAAELTITLRGAGGTTAANHYAYTRVKMPVTVRINYGYSPGYDQTISTRSVGWALIDYDLSDNQNWVQLNTFSPIADSRPVYTHSWLGWSKPRPTADSPYRGETLTAGPAGDPSTAFRKPGKQLLVGKNTGNWATNPGNTWDRLLFFLGSSRRFSSMKFQLTLRAGAASTSSVRARVSVIREHMGVIVAPNIERSEPIWTYTKTGPTPALVDSGWVYLAALSKAAQGVSLSIDHAPTGGPFTLMQVERIDIALDQEYAGYPVIGALSGELGGFSVALTEIINQNDVQTTTKFSLNTLMGVNDIATLDCAARTVAGALLKETAYRNPTWLRLLPGTNVIRIVGAPGSGQVRVKLKWQSRN